MTAADADAELKSAGHHWFVAPRADVSPDVDTAGCAGEWKPSIAAAREACELLRKMRPASIATKAQDRDVAEREAAILDNLISVADSLFAYASASAHPDPHLRDASWNRENAMLILGGAVSVAQFIFART